MGKDRIFEELGETLGRTAKMIGEKADDLVELQKFYSRSAGEKRQIKKSLEDLGDLIYHRHVKGETMDLEVEELCDKITGHKVMLARYEEEIARRKGYKICPACGRSIDRAASYCSYCGAHCEEDSDCSEAEDEFTDETDKTGEETQEKADETKESEQE